MCRRYFALAISSGVVRIRGILTGSPAFPGMGTGHPDLYKAFCWRFWRLAVNDAGRIGVVLPRATMSAKGSEDFRKEVFVAAAGVDLTTLVNSRHWVFSEVHPQYTIALAIITRGKGDGDTIGLRGPFASPAAFDAGHNLSPTKFSVDDVLSWNESAALPLLPTEYSLEIFTQLRKSPRVDFDNKSSWRVRPEQEMNATNQQDLMDLRSTERPKGFWPVYKGETFDIWSPDTGEYYAYADPEKVVPWLYAKRLRGGRGQRGGVHAEFPIKFLQDKATLACFRARIAFRDVSRATDSRTVRASLLPPKVVVVHNAPVLHWPRGDERDQAYLLGVLSSLPLDWFARRFVETHLQFFIFNALPVPRPPRNDHHWQRTVALAGRLACSDKRFASWAKAVGVECGPLQNDEKQDMTAELDAIVARLYGLTEKQLVHIFETFHEGWDYEPRLDSAMKYFRAKAKAK
jgi:hypothetical protein